MENKIEANCKRSGIPIPAIQYPNEKEIEINEVAK